MGIGFGGKLADVMCNCGGWYSFGGANVGSLSMHVAHGGGFGVGSILLNLFGGELRPGVKVTGIDGINPSGENRGE